MHRDITDSGNILAVVLCKLYQENLSHRGRQKKQWGDTIQQDVKFLRLKKEHTGERKKWRGGSEWLTPPLGGINSSWKEIHREFVLRCWALWIADACHI